MLQMMIRFSLFDRISDFSRVMSQVIVFFKHEVVLTLQSELDHELKNELNIHLMRHFVIDIAENVVKVNI
jgi:hypothetical protein